MRQTFDVLNTDLLLLYMAHNFTDMRQCNQTCFFLQENDLPMLFVFFYLTKIQYVTNNEITDCINYRPTFIGYIRF